VLGSQPSLTMQEMVESANASIAAWWDVILGQTGSAQLCRAQNPFQITTQLAPITLPSGQILPVGVYPLPADFYRSVSLDINIPSVSQYPLSGIPYNEEQRNIFMAIPFLGWGYPGTPICYMIQNPNIALRPVPNGTYALQLNYYPVAPQMAGPDSSLESYSGWEEWIVLDMSVKIALKYGYFESVPSLESRKMAEERRIRAAVPSIDTGSPERMHVTNPVSWSDDSTNFGW
jgi:hypothetical protein